MTIKARMVLLMLFVTTLTSLSLWGFRQGANELEGIYQRRAVGNTLVRLSEEITLVQRMLVDTRGEKHTALAYLIDNVFMMQTTIEMVLPEEKDGEIITALKTLLADLSSTSIVVQDVCFRLEHRGTGDEALGAGDSLRLAQLDSLVENVKGIARVYDTYLVAETERVTTSNNLFGILFVIALILTAFGILGTLFTQILRPLNAMRKTMQRISAEGDFTHRVEGRFAGEFGRLTTIFNGMVLRLSQTIGDLERVIDERKQAESALSEANKIINRSPTVALLWKNDDGWPVEFASENVEELFGYSAHEFLERKITYREIIHSDDLERVAGEVADHSGKEGAEKFAHEPYRINTKDGDTKWVRDETYIRRDSRGTITHFEGVVHDITERKRTEERVARLSRIFEDSLNEIYLFRTDTLEFTIVNRAALQNLGYEIEELRKLTPLDIKPEITSESFAELVAPLRSGEEKEVVFETVHQRKDQTLYDVEVHVQLLEFESEALFAAIILDITERNLAQEELRLRAVILDNVAEGVYLIGLDDLLIKWTNEKFERMFGYEPGELIGKQVDIVNAPTEMAPAETRMSIVDILKETGEWHGEVNNVKRDGTLFRCYANVSLFDHPEYGEVMVSVHTDISERRRAEEERESLQVQLNQAQKMESVGRLAGGVAHDFNNMLGVILGHTEMALDEMDPAEPLFDGLQEIRTAAERSADLTRQLLAFARKQTIAPRVLDLNEIIEGMLKMLRRLIGENIDLAWLPGTEAWPVKMDPTQIDQILANLCVNARDAIADVGRITIETGNTTFDEAYCAAHPGFVPGEYVLVAISDDGVGMDKEMMDNLFEPFFTTKKAGTGLGLATVYGIVKQNDGLIDVYSEPDGGTTFKIYLPRHTGEAEQVQKEGPAKPTARGHETILLVEDEPAILKLTAMMLERQGYVVLAASTPGEAIRLAREHAGTIHLLMTDVIMPEMNGRDLAKNLLSLYPDLKRLFMSGYTADVIAHRGVIDEGVNFIQKPFSVQDLATKVRNGLDGE